MATLFIIIASCLLTIFLESQTKVMRRAIDNSLYDSRNHYLPYEKMPTEAQEWELLRDH
jgi:hypothetical protein